MALPSTSNYLCFNRPFGAVKFVGMPRLSSFDSYEPAPGPDGSEWKVVAGKGGHIAAPSGFIAKFGDRAIIVGRSQVDSDRKISLNFLSRLGNSTMETFELAFPTSNGNVECILKPTLDGKYVATLPTFTVTEVVARLKVAIEGVGSAVYRNAWKDSEAAQKIYGYVSVEASNELDEETLVWLVSTLALHGFPRYSTD